MKTNTEPKIKLTKLQNGQWAFNGRVIERKEWCLPSVSISYRYTDGNGEKWETDTLREMRELIADLEANPRKSKWTATA